MFKTGRPTDVRRELTRCVALRPPRAPVLGRYRASYQVEVTSQGMSARRHSAPRSGLHRSRLWSLSVVMALRGAIAPSVMMGSADGELLYVHAFDNRQRFGERRGQAGRWTCGSTTRSIRELLSVRLRHECDRSGALRSREVAGWFTLPLRRSEPTGRCERGFCPVEGMPSPDSCSTRLGPGSLK